jgi:asparagine synthase (glutamine-hydrolysing)
LSGFIAIVSPEGAPVDPVVLDRMLDALRHRGPDGTGVWRNGSVALAHCQLALTKEAATEKQPHANESGTVRVVLDGRLDNRDELAGQLRADGLGVRDESDAEFLLRAYEYWGEACAARLLGDFAFAIWDGASQTLVCARDVLGIRPLYVHARDGFIAVASEIAPLLRHPAVRREPNEGFIAELLTGQIVNHTDTVWRDISRLRPAHLLTVRQGRVTVRRYWQIDPQVEIRYRRDDDYAEHLADLIRQAVRARCRSAGPVGVMLSGGIDSSSIVGAIHDTNAVNGSAPLSTFSIVSPEDAWDESPSVDAVAAMWPVSSQRFRAYEGDCAFYASEAAHCEDLPPYPNGTMAHPLFAAAANSGVRVLLTGIWSDEWFTGSFLQYADLLRRGHLGRFWRHYAAQPNRQDVFGPLSMFRSAFWPLVPPSARKTIKYVLGRDGIPPWVNRSLVSRLGLADRIRPAPPEVSLSTLAKTESYRMATNGLSVHATEAEARSVARFGLETRHPFGDRRIMEFGLAIPDEQRWHGPWTKFVLRNASRRWVPSLVGDRLTLAGASDVLLRAVQQHVESGLWDNSVVVRRNWIDLVPLRRAYNDMLTRYRASDDRYERLVFPLWLVCAVEVWARNALKEHHQHG